MLHKKSLATALATLLIFALVTLPAAAAPAPPGPASPSIVSMVLSWISDAVGLDDSLDKKAGTADPGKAPAAHDDGDDVSTLNNSSPPGDDPGNELGSFPEPSG